MGVIQGIVLGLIQGLTEFIPVSSSAHLVIVPSVLGWGQPGVFFDVMLHTGTLAAAIIYFRKDIFIMLKDETRSLRGKDGKTNTLWLLVLATMPAAFAGVAFKKVFESFFDKPADAAYLLIVTGLLLAAADLFGKQRKTIRETTPVNALVVGAFQALAILPGISRSGATISAGMYAGLRREAATRFAFLLSIPIIAGTTLLKLKDVMGLPGGGNTVLVSVPGAIVAAVSGYFAIRFMLRYLAHRRLTVFTAYCWCVAAVYLLTH